jgi:putative nucleotidyltransferase with HDIG domain
MKNRFDHLLEQCPPLLRKRIEGLKGVPQNPKWHPEGNVYVHTKVVVNRLSKHQDLVLSWAAMFHDIGKDTTTEYESGKLHAIGHERVSAKLVTRYFLFLLFKGVNPFKVREIVLNHMRIKMMDKMKENKQMRMRRLCTFGLLQVFTVADTMSTLTEQELTKIKQQESYGT